MNKNLKISKLQFAVLLIYPILTTFHCISFNNILETSKIDSYLAVIYAFLIGIIPLISFIYILNYKPELSLPDKNIHLFGKIIGTIINYTLIFIISIIGIIILYSTSSFIMIHYLKETPRIIILIVIGIIVAFNVIHGIEVITRTSFIFFIIIIILTICSTAGLITKFDINNIKPFLEFGLNKTLLSGNIIVLNNILPIFILLIIPKNYIKDNNNISKYILTSYIISMLLIFIITLLSIGILGNDLLKIYSHPEYIILKKLSIFGFIDRIENIVYLKWIFNSFICLILIVYYISNTIKTEDKTRIIPTIITIIITIFSNFLFKNNIEFNRFINKNYHYFNITFFTIFIIIVMNIFIRKKIKKRL